MLLPCWSFGAQPEYLLVALQSCVVGRVATGFIARVVPLCHERVPTFCKGCLVIVPLGPYFGQPASLLTRLLGKAVGNASQLAGCFVPPQCRRAAFAS